MTSCGGGAFPATTCSIPATGTGNLLVVAFSSLYGTTPSISGVTDSAGNTYTEAGSARAVDSAANQMLDIWYARNSKGGATSVTINPNPSGSSGGAVIWEFSGVDPNSPLEQTTVLNTQPATTTPSGAPVATTSSSDIIVSVMVPSGSVTGLHAGNAFTNDFAGFYGVGWAHMITAGGGAYAAQWDTSSGTYASATVAFRANTAVVNSCDLASPYGVVDATDVAAAKNMALGVTRCTANIVGPNVCDVVMVQRVINASLGGACVTGTSGGGATTASHSVSLTWLASTSTDVTGYRVYRSTTSGGPYTALVTLGNTTSYTDSAVSGGTTYYYVVKALSSSSLESTWPSNQAQAVVPTP